MIDLYTVCKIASGRQYGFYAPGEWTLAKACDYAERRFWVQMSIRNERTQTVYVEDEDPPIYEITIRILKQNGNHTKVFMWWV